MRKNENAVYVNCPLPVRIARELRAQAMRNGRPAGREGALIITKAITKAKDKAKCTTSSER